MAQSPQHRPFTRRQALSGIVGIAGAAILAACGDTAGGTPTAGSGSSTLAAGATTAPAVVASPSAPNPMSPTGTTAAVRATATTGSPGATATPEALVSVPTVAAVGTLPNKLIEIEYWHRNPGPSIQALETFAAGFNMQYTGKVKVTSIFQGDLTTLNKKIRAAATGGGLPGVTMGDDPDINQYAFSKIIVPLDAYIDDPQYGLTKDERANFLPNQIGRQKLPVYNNETMAFPHAFSTFAAAWNVDALAKAGFSGPPKTWGEFPDHVRAVAKANPGMAGWIADNPGPRFMTIMLTYGMDWITPDGKASTFDRPAPLEVLTWWKQLYDEKLLQFVANSTTKDAFAAQKSVYDMETSTTISTNGLLIKDFKWDAGMPPQGSATGILATETFGPMNAMLKTDPEKQLASWLWLKYLTTPDPLAQWVQTVGYFPSTKSVVDSPTLKEFYAKSQVAGKLAREVAPNGRILSPHPALNEVRNTIVPNVIDQVFLGQLTPDAGVKKMKADADKAIRNALQS